MEGLRGFAVFLVFLVHYASVSEPWTGEWLKPLSAALHSIGNKGVDVFFALSGYLIYGSLISKKQPFGKFIARRAQRIYPAFLAVLAIYVALSLALPAESKLPSDGAATYLLLNILLLPGIFPIEPIITVAWSLSYEMFFYLTIPILVAALRLRSWSAKQRFALSGAAALCIIMLVSGEYTRIAMFLGGIMICDAMKFARAPSARLATAGLIVMLSTPLLPLPGQAKAMLILVSCCLLCWHCFAANSLLTQAASWTPLRWLGNMSYSYYLIHGLSLKFAFMVLGVFVKPGHDLFLVLFLPMLAFTLVPSAVLFMLIEKPLSLRVEGQQKPLVQPVPGTRMTGDKPPL
jgi:exopolysaccharide production protein ExoZ